MQAQRIIRYGLDRFGRDETAWARCRYRRDGCDQDRGNPVVPIDRLEARAHGMDVQVLSRGMMVVLVLRSAVVIGVVGRCMGVVDRLLMRRLRLGMKDPDMPMRRGLEQVRQGQDQDRARPDRSRVSREHDVHDPSKLAPEFLRVNRVFPLWPQQEAPAVAGRGPGTGTFSVD
ncbi:MAG: hypothetical protein C0395_03565 [Gemmatimonas sp.]|nr:hypothetical protein [Gemmatimonas sp.]